MKEGLNYNLRVIYKVNCIQARVVLKYKIIKYVILSSS